MQPIFTEFINFMKDKGYDIPITEGTYWLDNGFIKAFTPDGVLHKLYKYRVFEDLSISVTKYKEYIEAKFETWSDTVNRERERMSQVVESSLNVIDSALKEYSDHEWWVMTSTGKDSCVVLDLIQKRIPDVNVMFNNTSCDVADTYKIVKSHPEWVITNPKEGIYKYFQRMNFVPTRFSRACCRIYKEGGSIEWFKEHNKDKLIQVMGVRNDESLARADRQDITINPKWDNPNWIGLLPIRKWSDFDVWLYILDNNLELNPKYKKGYTRVGCAICCAYYSKSTWVLDKYFYPKLYNRWHETLEKFFIEHRNWQKLNCTVSEFHHCWSGGLLRPEPTEEVITEMMQYMGITEHETAEKYFNRTCSVCGKNVRREDALGMNLKLFGRNTGDILCKKHLKEKLGISEKEYWAKVAEFKQDGCVLF